MPPCVKGGNSPVSLEKAGHKRRSEKLGADVALASMAPGWQIAGEEKLVVSDAVAPVLAADDFTGPLRGARLVNCAARAAGVSSPACSRTAVVFLASP
mmetsp:Transcript_107169/g.269524  ORF Transcript_107169/g.269524 Transcript_107169/m.269524 type:complete len:98 (+) Transcript_107169:299-592(+)